MSSAGIRKQKTFPDRTIDIIRDQEQDFIQQLKVTGTESSFGGVGSSGETSGGAPQDPPGNFLEIGGGTMRGPIAYFPQNVTVDANNEISIGFEQGAYSSYIKMTATGATDDLINIIGAQYDGQDLILQGTTGKTITLKTTGNIIPPGGADFDIVDEAIVRCIFDPTTDKWLVYTSGGGTGGGSEFFGPWTANHNAGGFDLLNLNLIEFDIADNKIFTSPLGMTFLTPVNDSFEFFVNTIGVVATLDQISLRMEVNIDLKGNSIDNVSTLISNAADPGDTGFIRMGNGETINWESNPAGVDVGFQVNTNNEFEFSGTLVPNTTQGLGTNVKRWGIGYFTSLDVSGIATFFGDMLLGNGPLDTIYFNGILGTDIGLGGFNLDNVGVLISNAADPGDTGFIRMGNGETINWESNPAGVDVGFQVNTNNEFEFSGNLVPNVSQGLGTNAKRWGIGYFTSLDVSGIATFFGDMLLGNGPADTIYYNGVAGTPIKTGANYLDFTEMAAPTAILNHSLLYSKDVAAVSHLFTRDSDGTEHDLSAGGGSGATQQLDNLLTTAINAQLNLNNGVNILPLTDLGSDLGDSTHSFSLVYFRNLFLDDPNMHIKNASNNMVFTGTSGNDIVFNQGLSEFFRCDGGLSQITFGSSYITEFNNDIKIDNGSVIRSNDTVEIGYFVTNYTGSTGTRGSNQSPYLISTTKYTTGQTNAILDGYFGAVNGAHGVQYDSSEVVAGGRYRNWYRLNGIWVAQELF